MFNKLNWKVFKELPNKKVLEKKERRKKETFRHNFTADNLTTKLKLSFCSLQPFFPKWPCLTFLLLLQGNEYFWENKNSYKWFPWSWKNGCKSYKKFGLFCFAFSLNQEWSKRCFFCLKQTNKNCSFVSAHNF